MLITRKELRNLDIDDIRLDLKGMLSYCSKFPSLHNKHHFGGIIMGYRRELDRREQRAFELQANK